MEPRYLEADRCGLLEGRVEEAELNRAVTAAEYDDALECAREAGLHRGFV